MALNKDKLDEMAQPRPQEEIEAAKRRKAARKVTKNRKAAQEFLKAAGIMTPEGELSSNYIA